MRFHCIIVFSLCLQFCIVEAFEYSEWEIQEIRRALADWEKSIEATPIKYDVENIRMLGEAVRKLSRNKPTFPEWRIKLYSAAREKLLAIPGHAEYFRDEIENERIALKPDSYRGSYDRSRAWLFETFGHLPSPETIKVLGEFLDDERDLGERPAWTSDGILMGLNPNSAHSLRILKNIGLRDPGFTQPDVGERPKREDYATWEEALLDQWIYGDTKRRTELKAWRDWYQKVRSGEMTFSFKGQDVEYRFNPDGTWETIPIANPPEDTPSLVPERKKEEKLFKTPPTFETETDQSIWAWVGVGITFVFVVVIGILKFRK